MKTLTPQRTVLAQQRYFEQPGFINYLKYLKYWQDPKYAKYICYPYSLEILDLLQHQSFRDACLRPETQEFIHSREYNHWRFFRAKRIPEEHGKVVEGELLTGGSAAVNGHWDAGGSGSGGGVVQMEVS
ncbi:Mediator of RNA polymerase II transcription subunit 31 [Rhizophlyctis rosea]|nr:Mediator of RNA polymerase II transcription subunit 31 [Rhizophlyctis rosea]